MPPSRPAPFEAVVDRPLTLDDWRRAVPDAVTAQARLGALVETLQAGCASDPAWIFVAPADDVASQVHAVAARAAALPDRAAVLRAMPLFCTPYAVKDNIDVAGWPTSAACPAFTYRADSSAAVVLKLQQAGAICVGKTNLDQFATGLVGTRSPFGRPASAFSAEHVSGGSSSGSAVVVARGLLPFALGTDTAGSGRVPAGFNHVVGLKPTPGRTGMRGVLPACRSIDCLAVFALTVGDAAEVLAVIEGEDADDAWSNYAPGPARFGGSRGTPGGPAARLRVGVPAAPRFFDTPGDTPGYAACWRQAVVQLEAIGHRAVPIDFAPLHATARLLYDGPWVAERHAVVRGLLAEQPDAFDPAVRRVIESAMAYSATDAFVGQYALREMQRDHAALWQQVDVLMVPTATAHPRFADVDADPLGANARLGHYTNFVNLLRWCALAVPAGYTDGAAPHLPFGVTFIADAGHDAALAHFGLGWQAALRLPLGATGAPWRHPPPPLRWPASAPVLPLAVVGAHLSGLPLNRQLLDCGAALRAATHTAPRYRLYALPDAVPPKPGLLRVAQGGAAVAVEVWEVPQHAIGGLLAQVAAPLGLGQIELADGSCVHGFVCEAHALAGARDITAFGGWRAYLQATAGRPPAGIVADNAAAD